MCAKCVKAAVVATVCKEAAVVATERQAAPRRTTGLWARHLGQQLRHWLASHPGHAVRRARLTLSAASGPRAQRSALLQRVAGVLAGLAAMGQAQAVELPGDRAEAMYHHYDGGGTRASGPALLVRKKLGDNWAISGSYYIDAVSNASIDVVTTASPYKEKRTEYGFSVDHSVRDTLLSLSATTSKEPDYVADGLNVDLSQEVFGGMTTVSLGFSRGADQVGRKDVGFFDEAHHWRYRLGATQILSPRWLLSANYEAVADEGYLGNPYRVARVFGAAVPERNPRTRASRSIKFRVIGEVMPGISMHADYRYFWDTWDIKAHTFQVGGTRYFGANWLADAYLRVHNQGAANFYSDNARTETIYISRNRQLGEFTSFALGNKLSYTYAKVAGKYEVKLNAAYELARYNFKNFTDIRTGAPYSYDASILQLFVTATF
jgi:hypothetical protein